MDERPVAGPGAAGPLPTVPAKTILTRTKSTAWFGCEYNMNLYRGCCHGCLYCDSRSDCYHVEAFDTVRVKRDALRILRDQLARRLARGVVASGAMSDPYNPFEAAAQYTRRSLELLHAYGFGAALATKSDLILRDADVLTDIAAQAPVLCKITITTADDVLAAKLEPRAPAPSRRFAALDALAKRGLFCGVLLMPVLPFVQDDPDAIRTLLRRAAASGARFVYPAFGVTMRPGQREYFLQGLDAAFPGQDLVARYRSRFGSRYFCASPKAQQLWALLQEECARSGLLYQMGDIVAAYRQGYGAEQLSFL